MSVFYFFGDETVKCRNALIPILSDRFRYVNVNILSPKQYIRTYLLVLQSYSIYCFQEIGESSRALEIMKMTFGKYGDKTPAVMIEEMRKLQEIMNLRR